MGIVGHCDLTGCDSDPAHRAAAGLAAWQAFRDTGFLILHGHGVPRALIDQAYATAQALFALPLADKQAAAGGLRGYTPFGREHARDASVADLKEFWQVGRDLPAGQPDDPLFPPNVWPTALPEAEAAFTGLFAALDRAGRMLLSVLAPRLGLPADHFEAVVEGGPSLLRVLHYPPVPDGADPRAVRAAAHEDINFITLMVGARGAGLEILGRDGGWHPVLAEPGTLIVNAGDMLARITGGLIPATTHRVVNPAGPNESRYSMPFFLHPRNEVELTLLPGCAAQGGVAQPHITAGAFLAQRLREIGLA